LFLVWLSKTGILELDRHRADHAVADVLAGEAVLGVLVDPLEDALAEGALVGAAVVGVLAVDEAEVGLAVGVGVGEGELEAVALAVDDRRRAAPRRRARSAGGRRGRSCEVNFSPL
jgi:hypothetical protein